MDLARGLVDGARDARSPLDLCLVAVELICRDRGWPIGRVSLPDSVGPTADRAFRASGDPNNPDDGGNDGSRKELQSFAPGVDAERRRKLEEGARALASPRSPLCHRARVSGSPVWIEDLERDGELSLARTADRPPSPGFDAPVGLRGALVVPVTGREGIRALLCFFDEEPRPPRADELDELEGLGSQLGWMVEFAEQQNASRKSQRRLEDVVEAIRAIGTAGMDPETVMRVTAERSQELTGATSAGVFLRAEEDADILIMRGASGNAVPYLGQPTSISQTLSGHAFEQGEVLASNDTSLDPRVNQEAVEDTGLRSLIAVPLQADGDRVVGLLNVMSSHRNAFDEEDQQLLQLLSEQMGSAVDRARAFQANQRLLEDLSDTADALEDALEEQEAILDASLHAIIAMDSELRVSLWSRAAEELYGWTEDEVVGADLPILPEFREAEARKHIGRVLEGAAVRSLDVTHVRKDGTPVEVRLSAAPVRSADGDAGVVAVVMDMSEIRKVEARLRQAERMESVGRLAGGIAHDFNNMLTAMRGNAELLLLSDLDPEDEGAVRGIMEAVDRAEAVTRQLLAYSRRQHMEARPLRPAHSIREMSSLLEHLLGERITLLFDLDDECGPVLADPAQLDRIVMNLVLNARDSMPEGGTIRIGCIQIDGRDLSFTDLDPNEDGTWVEISVSDEGEGVPPEIRERIFEPFFSTKSPGRGTGLGLATVYGVVHQSGGAIRLETTMGEGSTFHVYLPVVDAASSDTLPDAEGEGKPPGDVRNPSRAGDPDALDESAKPADSLEAPIVLLVENAEGVDRLVRRILEPRGYEVRSTPGPEGALKCLGSREHRPSILITDASRGRGRLSDFLDQVRARRPDLPVLVVTEEADPILGAASHGRASDEKVGKLLKPFSPDTLVQRLSELLGDRAPNPGSEASL